jgi:Aspartyl protease
VTILAVLISLAQVSSTFAQPVKWHSFDYTARNIFVRCTLTGNNGVTFEADLILDTGNNRTTLDPKVAQKLGLIQTSMTRTQTPTATSFTPVMDLPALRIGNASATHVQINTTDMSRAKALYRRNVDGLLGTDVLQDKTLSLDFAKRLFSLDAVTTPGAGYILDLDATPFGGLLLVPVTLPNNLTMLTVIDTGADHNTDFMFYADALYSVDISIDGSGASGDMISENRMVIHARTGPISLGTLVIKSPTITVEQPVTVNPYGTKYRPGLLTCKFLEQYFVQLDFPKHRLKLAVAAQK